MKKIFESCVLMISILAAGVSAKGLYLEGSLGIAKADYVEQERPRRLRQADDHVGECLDIEGCKDTGPSGEYAPRDKVEYVGYGPVLDLKVGYGWEKLAVFGVIQGTYTEGLHNFDCYVVGEPVEYTGDETMTAMPSIVIWSSMRSIFVTANSIPCQRGCSLGRALRYSPLRTKNLP